MPKTTPAGSWCLFRDHPTVRLAVRKRIDDRGLKLVQVADMTNIAVYRISRYLLKRKPNLNQYQLFTLCQKLGINIKINIEFM